MPSANSRLHARQLRQFFFSSYKYNNNQFHVAVSCTQFHVACVAILCGLHHPLLNIQHQKHKITTMLTRIHLKLLEVQLTSSWYIENV